MASGDAKLIKLGMESIVDRKRVMAIVTEHEEPSTLMNWFEVKHIHPVS